MSTDTCQRELKNRVRERRKFLRLTQAELAARAGLARQTVIQIERGGGYEPLTPAALRLASALAVDVAWLFYEEAAS